jgi:hypothetical protein
MTHFQYVAAAIIGIMSVARTARLLIHDSLPPVVWLRTRVLARYADDSEWSALWQCHYCMAPYLAAGMGLWFWLGGDHWTWWVINGWWGASYLAAIVVSYDEP